MNLKITAAVAAALACSAPAFASNIATTQAPQVKLVASGSSAERDAMLALMASSACQAGTFDVYRISPSGNQDFRAYSCTLQNDPAFGTAAGKTATVYYRSEGGSAFGPVPIATGVQVMRKDGDLDVIVFGLIMMLVMIFLPRGLVRGLMDLWEFRRYKREGGRISI